MSRPEDQIVFEDLHGVNEDESVTIDLDAGTKDDGITRTPADQAADDGGKDDDSVEFDELRSADKDADPDADPKPDDDDAASKAGEDDDYSKKVKARIERERRAKRKAQKESEYWQQQAESLAKDQYERDKKGLERDIEQADSALEQTEADLEKAIEDGDTKGQVRLTKRLSDLKADRVLAESRLENLSPDGNVQPFDGKISTTKPKDAAETAKWVEDRSDWYRQDGFERATRLANRLDREVFNDGFDPDTPEYFKELDKRIKAKMPELYEDLDDTADDKDDNDKKNDKRPTRSPVAPVDSAEDRQTSKRSSKVELGEEDFANMRRFGLDTKDPEVLKEYARNKREAESGARR